MSYHEIYLHRNAFGELGLSISGGLNTSFSNSGIFVSEILENGPAKNKLSLGDIIISVNGTSMQDVTHEYAVNILTTSGPLVILKVFRPSHSHSESANLIKNDSNSSSHLSMFADDDQMVTQPTTFREKKEDSITAHPLFLDLHVKEEDNFEERMELTSRLVVKNVSPNSSAFKSGFRPGDRLVSVNGIDVARLSLIEAAKLFKSRDCEIKIARYQLTEYPKSINSPYEHLSSFRKNNRRSRFNQPNDCKCSKRSVSGTIATRIRTLSHPSVVYSKDEIGLNQFSSGFSDGELYNSKIDPNKSKLSLDGLNIFSKSSNDIHKDWADVKDVDMEEYFPIYANANNLKYHSITKKDLYLKKNKKKPFHLNVSIIKCPRLGSGIKIFGGNATGLFVAEVHPESAAFKCGLKTGDQIVKINDLDVIDWTKEDAVVTFMKSEPRVNLKLLRDLSKFKLARKIANLDSFFVRAFFNYHPPILNPMLSRLTKYNEFAVRKGDVFHVTDTMLNNELGSWKAIRVYPKSTGDFGILPNLARAEQISKWVNEWSSLDWLRSHKPLMQFSHNSSEISGSGTIYERVVMIPTYPYPRPIVFYGPLSDLSRRALLDQVAINDGNLNGYSRKFEIPPVNANHSIHSNSAPGLIRLSAIKECMRQGNHCLLDILPSAVERLILIGLCPIVILILPQSYQEIKILLNYYKEVMKNQSKSSNSWFDQTWDRSESVKSLAKQFWSEVINIQKNYSHLITDTVPLFRPQDFGTINAIQRFKDLEAQWISNLVAIIKYQQNQSIWVGETTNVGIDFIQKLATEKKQEIEYQNILSEEAETFDSSQDLILDNRIISEKTNINSMDHKNIRVENNNDDLNYENDPRIAEPVKKLRRATIDALYNRTNKISTQSDYSNMDMDSNASFVRISSPRSSERTSKLPIIKPNDKGLIDLSSQIHVDVVDMIDDFDIPMPTPSETADKVDGRTSIHSKNESIIHEERMPKRLFTPNRSTGTVSFKNASNQQCESLNNYGRNSNFCEEDFVIAKPSSSGLVASPISSFMDEQPKRILAECSGHFDHRGGELNLPDHQVYLQIPPGAIPKSSGKTFIFLRIYQDFDTNCSRSHLDMIENGVCEHSHIVSPMVMCGPRGLKFRRPVELIMPRYQNEHRQSEEALQQTEGMQESKWSTSLLHGSTCSPDNSSISADTETTNILHAPQIWHEVRPWSAISLFDTKTSRTHVSLQDPDVPNITSIFNNNTITVLIDRF